MVVDDTITYRMILKKVVEKIPNAEIMATASNGKIALAKITTEQPDIILLDVEMPQMDGLSTLKILTAQYPKITVVMVSGVSRSNANIVMECLNAGAMDFVTKPEERNADRAREVLRKELEPILAIVEKKALTTGGVPVPSAPPTPVRPDIAARPVAAFGRIPMPASRLVTAPALIGRLGGKPVGAKPELLLIGSSTGGPAALTKVLSKLGGKLSIPALIVQHMPPVFTASLASQLSRASGLQVREAREDMPITAGGIILAMGGKHMTVKKRNNQLVVGLNEGPKVNECRPAVDVLFMSTLASFSGSVLTVILTGMGRDGANGVDALKRGGKAYCITQDKESCVVYGMPRAVDEMSLSDERLPVDQIGQRIAEICL
jgi:two-component system chemotaxis response regulator CheB